MANPSIDISCCVCSKPITDNNSCFSMGSEGYRHKKCCVGSKAWKAKYGLSEIGAMMETKHHKPDAGPMTKAAEKSDPTRKAIKEFLGRDKYMRYMDSITKNLVWWTLDVEINGHNVTSSKDNAPPSPEVIYDIVSK